MNRQTVYYDRLCRAIPVAKACLLFVLSFFIALPLDYKDHSINNMIKKNRYQLNIPKK